ncbi:MAG: hypothetical protein LBS35_03770 [Synergistaceae bacterium]|jgi:hypothetical protein|nr:hypothetical protein [Synergistaceae bacterium]
MKILCDSGAVKNMPKWMRAFAIALGIVLIYNAHFVLGVICVLGAGISRRLYLSDAGAVRETRAWGRVVRRVLPWEDINCVTLAYKGGMMMVFLEVGPTGWKMPFLRGQSGQVQDVIGRMMPDMDIETL